MYSLSSSSPIPNLEWTKALIRRGGAKAAAWMNDKEVGSLFVIPAVYQPASQIPLAIWQAAPSTSNGNEQAHRNVNRTRLPAESTIIERVYLKRNEGCSIFSAA
ncbi:hypothetical protein K439DRAFT_1405257 [Ramaria rubella]|nr:hypothetical protein K439DRAFT_1405257 [Ramaria rubella]